MSDWELVDNNSTKSSQMAPSISSDWELIPQASNQMQARESFLSKLPRNIATGLANRGHFLLNMPHDTAQNLQQQGQQFGQMVNNALPTEKYGFQRPQFNLNIADQIPYQQEQNFAQMLGQKGEPTFADTVVQKGVQYAPELLMGVNALKDVMPHLTKRGAVRTLNKAKQLAEGREIGTLNVNPELIKDARQYLPNNLTDRDLVGASQTGDYNSLFDLQSKVGKISAKRIGKIRSIFSPESQIKGESGLEARNRLLKSIHENLQSLGHNDISDLLKQGQNEYRRYMKFKPYRNAIIGAGATAVAKEVVPKNPLTDLVNKLLFHTGG